jgi:Protein of unknown function (DUF2934)
MLTSRNGWVDDSASPPSRKRQVPPLVLVPFRLTPQERHRRISELAYRRAEQRGFVGGNELEDWLEAEREVDAGRY